MGVTTLPRWPFSSVYPLRASRGPVSLFGARLHQPPPTLHPISTIRALLVRLLFRGAALPERNMSIPSACRLVPSPQSPPAASSSHAHKLYVSYLHVFAAGRFLSGWNMSQCRELSALTYLPFPHLRPCHRLSFLPILRKHHYDYMCLFVGVLGCEMS